MKQYFILCILLVTALLSANVLDKTNVSVLNQLSIQYQQEFEREYNRAISLAKKNNWLINTSGTDGSETSLIEVRNGIPIYYGTNNAKAAKTISTNEITDTGSSPFLTGSGIEIRMWDGSGIIRDTHREFNGRITLGEIPTLQVKAHGTSVAGTMIASGVSSNAKGMAPNATVKDFNWHNDKAEMAAEAASGALLSNHSYGEVCGWRDGTWTSYYSSYEDYRFGFYSDSASELDQITYSAPYYLQVWSAGNDRSDYAPNDTHPDDGPYDCMGPKKTAKNILTVGAVEDVPNGYTNPNSVIMTSFSNWGPTDDGRIKPDICANGYELYTSTSDSDDAYDNVSGTSFAAPSVTGSCALLQQHYHNLNGTYMLASTLKGLVINTADECGTSDGPDYEFGWGLMNTKEAIDTISEDGINSYIGEFTLHDGEVFRMDVFVPNAQSLTATLCWTDVPGNPVPIQVDPTNSMLVNDLDMRITDQNNNTFYPWTLDPANPSNPAVNTVDNAIDNVEKINIDCQTSIHRITISHKGTLTSPQTFSLILNGVTPPEIVSGVFELSNNPTYFGTVELTIHNVTIGKRNTTLFDADNTFSLFLNSFCEYELFFRHSSSEYENYYVHVPLGTSTLGSLSTIQFPYNPDHTLIVGQDYPTIQNALDRIQNGGVVVVPSGTYTVDNLTWRDKHIKLLSMLAVPATLTSSTHAINLDWEDHDNTDIIEGFIFDDCNNAYEPTAYGLAIALHNGASPHVKNCTFTDANLEFLQTSTPDISQLQGAGATVTIQGVHNQVNSPLFTNCDFSNNFAGNAHGGGAVALFGQATFEYCTFDGNYCQQMNGAKSTGGAILIANQNYVNTPDSEIYTGNIIFDHCVFVDNQSQGGVNDIDLVSSKLLTSLSITDCSFERTTGAIPSETNASSIRLIEHDVNGNLLCPHEMDLIVERNTFKNYDCGIVDFFDYWGTSSLSFRNNVIDVCDNFGLYVDYSGSYVSNYDYFIADNNTFLNIDGDGIVLDCGDTYTLRNNIFSNISGYGVKWGLGGSYATENVNISYCLFNQNTLGDWDTNLNGVINASNNLFNDPNLDSADYRPIWASTGKSPCINAGDPDLDGDGINWLTDTDDQDDAGTQMDIGAKTYLNSIKQNIYELSNDEVKYFSVPSVYNPANTTHTFNTWENVFNKLIDNFDFMEMKWKWNDSNINHPSTNTIPNLYVCSQYGYKIKYNPNAASFTLPFEYDGFLPGNTNNAGMYLSNESRYTTKLYILEPEENQPNCAFNLTTGVLEREIYLGYYKEGSLNPFVALQPIINDITAIYAEDWGMSRMPVPGYVYQTGDEPSDAYTDNWLGRTEADADIAINYGDMVVVKYIGTSNVKFKWGGTNPNPPYLDQYKRVMATHFEYEEQLEYMPIYIDIDMDEYEDGEKPVEVAVFVNKKCKGAAVINEGQAQLNAYVLSDSTTAVSEMTFQFWFPTKSKCKKVQNYEVYNPLNGKYERKIANVSDYSDFLKVSFSDKDLNEGIEVPRVTKLTGNYPNPFNPTTTILFDIAKDGNAKLEIFNIKGQKVKTLFNEEIKAGSYNIKWHGEDDNHKPLASGVYFSRLTTSEKALTKKMILLK